MLLRLMMDPLEAPLETKALATAWLTRNVPCGSRTRSQYQRKLESSLNMMPCTVFKYIKEGLAVCWGYILENPREQQIRKLRG